MGARITGPTRRATVAMLAALLCLTLAAPAPAGPEPTPPHARVDVVAVAHAVTDPDWVPWIDDDTGRPYRLLDPRLAVAIDPSITDHVGRQPIVAGLTAFNDVPGSAVDVSVTADLHAADVRVVEVPCQRLDGKQGRARPHVLRSDDRAAWVGTARIEVCRSLREQSRHYARHLMAHELAHVLGIGHLCEQSDCWPLDRRPHPCEFMRPSVHPCQDLDSVRAALPTLYPGGAPRG